VSSDSQKFEKGSVVYRRLLTYVKPYWLAFIFSILGMGIVASTEVGFAALMQPMLDGTFVDKNPTTMAYVPLAIIGIFLIRGLGSFSVGYFMAWVGRNVIRDLRLAMFEHVMCLPTRFYDTQPSGKLISKLVYDVEQVAEASSRAITVIIQDTLTIVGLLSWMFYINWKLALLFTTVGPLLSLLVLYVNRRLRRFSQRLQNSVGDVTHIAQQAIEAQRVIKVFGGQQHERDRFQRANENNRRQFMKIVVTNAASTPIVQLMAALLLAAIVFLSAHPSMENEISVGTFMSFVTAMLLLFPPLKRLTTVNAVLQRGIAAAQSLFDFLDTPSERDNGQIAITRSQGHVRFRHVNFQYHGDFNNDNSRQVLSGIDFEANPGEVIAIVGRSGSGKSTLVSLIPRFYQATQGEVYLDGENIAQLSLASLRKQIALVSQDIILFNDTIRHNIAYGCLDSASDKRIEDAAQAANAMSFIEALPEGLETIVGEHGALLSGGQRQRIAIARALLKNAPILILDEATSALDSRSERAIQTALERLMKARTTFVIAHRLSTIETADKIIVLQEGRIVELGDHQTLLAANGHYTVLHNMQFS